MYMEDTHIEGDYDSGSQGSIAEKDLCSMQSRISFKILNPLQPTLNVQKLMQSFIR